MRNITTINYWNNNNKIKLLALILIVMTMISWNTKTRASELNGMPYTQVEQGMNISYNYIDTNYHYVEVLAQGKTEEVVVTLANTNDTGNKIMFLEIEDLNGKLISRTRMDSSIMWGYFASIDNVSVLVTLSKESNSFYPCISFLNRKGEIEKTIKCSESTTEVLAKNVSLAKINNKIYFCYTAGNNLVLLEINQDGLVASTKKAYSENGSSAFFYYDSINDKTWMDYKYNNRSRLMEYVCLINNLDDINYTYASKNKVTKEMLNANASFEKWKDDTILINYSNKKYNYTYSTKKLAVTTETPDGTVLYENDTKMIFYKTNSLNNTETGRVIYFVNKQGSYDIELFENNDNTIYVGANGLDIKGIIHSPNDEVVDANLVLNNLNKIFQIKTNEEFCLHLGPEILKEGYYDDIRIEVGSSNNDGVMFGEIPNGSTVNYNGIFYDKVDDTLAVERDPQKPVSTTATEYDKLDKSSLLTTMEWEKYKEYISAKDRVVFWLQDDLKINKGEIFTSKKLGYSYLINKQYINMNEKFSYNKNDGAYYNYIAGGSNASYKPDVWVSYAPCKEPIATVSSSDFTSSDVKMNIHFDGECSNIIVKAHVIKEDLNGVAEDDLTFDFNLKDNYDYIFDQSGIYQVTLTAESSYGNKSNSVIKTFKIDKEGPVIKQVIYDNTSESAYGGLWSKSRETTVHIILEDLSGVPNSKQIDKYLYQIDKEVISKKPLSFDAYDNCNNASVIKLDNDFYVDEIEPILQDEVVEYYKDKVEIKLLAFDTESGLDGIYYKIGEEDEKKYDKKIIMQREKYGQKTEVNVYARDIAGNCSDIKTLIINLNDAPEIILEDENFDFTLDNLVKVHVITNDKDGDEVLVSAYYNDELLLSNINELIIDLKQFEDLIKTFEYNKTHKLKIVAFDGMDETIKHLNLCKKNMKPVYKINTKSINFTDYAETEISIYDLDDDSYGKTTCIVSCNKTELGTYELKPGDNVIKIKNLALSGIQELSFKLINANYKETIVRKINLINLEEIGEENVFIKIGDTYTEDFFTYAASLRQGVFFYTENAERFLPLDLKINLCKLADAKSYILNKIPVIICEDNITDNDLLELIKTENQSSLFCYETGSEANLNPIIFSDYEKDYYKEERGKDRKLNVKFDPLEFENTNDKYDYYIFDPFNNLTGDETKKKEVKFDKESLDFEISSSGFYTLSLNEWDDIHYNDVDYSKVSDNETISFYAHKKPVCELSYEEGVANGDNVRIKFTKTAYDEDYLSVNNGIWKEKVLIDTYSFDGNLIKEEILENSNKTFEIEINKNEITKVKYIVWDFGLSPADNRFSFSSFDEVVINKINTNPFADFEYYVGNRNANGYIYRMDEFENVWFNNTSIYNDLLATSGERKATYEFDLDEFKNMITNNEDLYNRITIKNKFGKTDTSISKKIDVCNINLINKTNLEEVSSGFAELKFDILNAKNKNEIYLMHDNEKITCANDEFTTYVYGNSLDEITITLKVYSKRDDSYLGEREFKVNFVQNADILDFNITNVYDPWCEIVVPVSVPEMPIGIIRKGYAFDFAITTKGLNNPDDFVYIIPTYYYLNEGKISPCEIVKYSKGRVTPYEMNILNGGKMIGNLSYIYLDMDDRNINNNEENYLGKFYLPADARAKVGNEIYNDGLILVNFEIVGASSSGFSVNYNTLKWSKLNNSPYNQSGDTAIFNLKLNAFDDYKNFLKY